MDLSRRQLVGVVVAAVEAGAGGTSLGTKCLADGGEVYVGPLANEALEAVGARASTMDGSIFVSEGSGTAADGALYAHEVVHIRQSSGKASEGCSGMGGQDAEEKLAMQINQRMTGGADLSP